MSVTSALTVEELKRLGYGVEFAGPNHEGDDVWSAIAPDGTGIGGAYDEDEAWQICRDHHDAPEEWGTQ